MLCNVVLEREQVHDLRHGSAGCPHVADNLTARAGIVVPFDLRQEYGIAQPGWGLESRTSSKGNVLTGMSLRNGAGGLPGSSPI